MFPQVPGFFFFFLQFFFQFPIGLIWAINLGLSLVETRVAKEAKSGSWET